MANFEVLHPRMGLWIIRDEGINLYLIAGEDRAILLDSGFGYFENLRAVCEGLCALPVTLYHTHAHGDHTGGDQEWEEAYLHPADWDSYRAERGGRMRLLPIADGERIDLGARVLEAVHVPGHSAGSTAFLDRENAMLFSGDTVMEQPVFLFALDASAAQLLGSLRHLEALRAQGAFTVIYPCHSRTPLTRPQETIADLCDCAARAVQADQETLVTYEYSLMPGFVDRFEGYLKGNCAVATRALDPSAGAVGTAPPSGS